MIFKKVMYIIFFIMLFVLILSICFDSLDQIVLFFVQLLILTVCFGTAIISSVIYYCCKKQGKYENINQLAYCDSLTKLGNRTAYLRQLKILQELHRGEQLALVMFDINDLKKVNDNLGHKAGDDMLVSSAKILKHSFGSPWHIFRIGGDEFIALYLGNDCRQAYELAEKIFIKSLKEFNETQKVPYHLSIAHGWTFCKITKDNINKAEKTADANMYKNKKYLKNKHRYYVRKHKK